MTKQQKDSNNLLWFKPKQLAFGVLLIVIFLVTMMVTGCGNTISGIGKDIQDGGKKMIDWQNRPDTADEKTTKSESKQG